MLIAGGIVIIGVGATGLAYYFSTNPREVFAVYLPNRASDSVPRGDAVKVARKFGFLGLIGAKVATKAQLAANQSAGANWCISSWVAESDGKTIQDAQYPMQDLPIDPKTGKAVWGCGAGHTVNTCTPPLCNAGVTIYGKKPKKPLKATDTVHGFSVAPWSDAEWNQPQIK